MAGPCSPGLLHHLDKDVGDLVPRPRVSFLLVPESRSSFRSLVPCFGVSFLVPDLTHTFITMGHMARARRARVVTPAISMYTPLSTSPKVFLLSQLYLYTLPHVDPFLINSVFLYLQVHLHVNPGLWETLIGQKQQWELMPMYHVLETQQVKTLPDEETSITLIDYCSS